MVYTPSHQRNEVVLGGTVRQPNAIIHVTDQGGGSGFDWGDAAIGAVAVLGIVLVPVAPLPAFETGAASRSPRGTDTQQTGLAISGPVSSHELLGHAGRRTGVRLAVMLIAVLAVSSGSAGCGTLSGDCSGPCPTGTHHWTAHELARDMASVDFPPQTDARDHLYRISCRITHSSARAVCIGRRRFGATRGQRVVTHALLRANGSWDLLCWPDPSQLCDRIQVREQRANPITS